MRFRTEVDIKKSEKEIHQEDFIFSLGSCFSSEISNILQSAQFQTINNPFGTIFNPFSVQNSIEKIVTMKSYCKQDLFFYGNEFLSFEHNSSFNSTAAQKILETINTGIKEAHLFLKKSKWVLITYGTSFVYEFLSQGKIVSNCHKIPQKHFSKRMLDHREIVGCITATIEQLKSICPEDLQILFTLSPVRHMKDGAEENLLSKSRLIAALHDVVSRHAVASYLPVYEIMMDDLRDYRFYKEDMIHPNSQAVEYIWKKFSKSYLSGEAQSFATENLKIKKALDHRPFNRDDPKYAVFLEQVHHRIMEQQKKVKHRIFASA